METCVICQIISGTIPSWVIYRDPCVICFLPKELDAYGHTVIAPIRHQPDIFSADPEALCPLFAAAQTLALHYRQQIGATGINLLHASGTSAQQSVPHLHLHLIPRFDGDGLDAWPDFPRGDFDKDEILGKLQRPTPWPH